MDEIADDDLPGIIEQYYAETKKKNDDDDNSDTYKNSTLKSTRAGLCRYFKKTRSIDIINSDRFIQANDMFDGVKRCAKEKGYAVVENYPLIDDSDLAKLKQYFETNMQGAPNARNL